MSSRTHQQQQLSLLHEEVRQKKSNMKVLEKVYISSVIRQKSESQKQTFLTP